MYGRSGCAAQRRQKVRPQEEVIPKCQSRRNFEVVGGRRNWFETGEAEYFCSELR
jgi:hypothetical protein